MVCPYIQDIFYQDPLQVFAHFSQQNNVVFLDSAEVRKLCGRYSFIAVDPFMTLIAKNKIIELNGRKSLGNPWQILSTHLLRFSCRRVADFPGFQGGAAGFFAYDLLKHLENVPYSCIDDMDFPDMALGFYDVVIGFDLVLQRAWIISHGFPLVGYAREVRAKRRAHWLMQELKKISALGFLKKIGVPEKEIRANFTFKTYCAAINTVIEHILAGDIFEANISQRFKTALPETTLSFDLYRQLRLLNPAPFAAYLHFNDTVIASASPERFLKLVQGQVEARPIKGTRSRDANKMIDEKLINELLNSEKDRAENVMIVDLLRNDLSRVCEDHSVKVSQLCVIESYTAVHHLVSVIEGRLAEKFHAVDLLCAAFPGGSITGAPKIRAMEIIAKIEPTCRGPYCGSVGYINFNGDMDSSILIRTYAIKNNIITFQAGGAIVMDSEAMAEYKETLTKVKFLRQALM